MNVQDETLKIEIRELAAEEIDAVTGGGFLDGFVIGVIAYNVLNDRPWYEF